MLMLQNDIEPWLTAVVFGVISIIGGLLALTLPETNKRPLPQTIEDVDNWYKPVGLPQPANTPRKDDSMNGSALSVNEHSVISDQTDTTTTTTSPCRSLEHIDDEAMLNSIHL